jgi:hypothetical protein
VHQTGEVYSHTAALLTDPETTIEVAFQPDRAFNTLRWEAHEAHIAYLDSLPEKMGADQANAVAYWRALNGRPIHDGDPASLTHDLLDIYAKPLRDALSIRRQLLEFGVEPHRIRLAFDDAPKEVHYAETRWLRAHLRALDAIRSNPVEARRSMVEAMRGTGEEAATRQARAEAVADRLFAEHEDPARGPEKYALLWVRDSRDQPVGGRHGPHLDTRPEVLRDIIHELRGQFPDRRIVLVGDDLFARRPELRDAWEREGVLDGVDTKTLVNFWDAARNGGERLSRSEQALFWNHLNTERHVIQIGAESGALELPMMLGMRTVFLEPREYDGNKGNRWALYSKDWMYGRAEPVRDAAGRLVFDDSGRPVTTFRGAERLPAPMTTVKRVLFGPDLPDPTNRRGQAAAVYLPAKVSVTADRIVRLLDSGEIDHWGERLGRTAGMDSATWREWNESDWSRSQYYTDQLHRWLQTDATTPEEIGRKWDAIRLSLTGVVEPGFTVDPNYEGVSIVHPYALLHSEHPLPADVTARIADAYAEGPGSVARVVKDLLAAPEVRDQALHDLRAFRLEPHEIHDMHEALSRLAEPDAHERIRPYDLGDGHRLDTPIAEGQPTPRQVLEHFEPQQAGLSDVDPADYIARNAADRPWLASARDLDPAVQRVIAAVDQGQGHFLERHGSFVDNAKLYDRVTRLADPAQLDPAKRALAIDGYAPGDREHRCPDTATSIQDPIAFATAFAGAVGHPDVQAALRTPFDPDRRPGRVSLPIADLLGPDGHRYCAGYRLEPVGGSLEAALDCRAAWLDAMRSGRTPEVPEPRAVPIETFEGGTVEVFFQPNATGDGYEVATMFVDPPAPAPQEGAS